MGKLKAFEINIQRDWEHLTGEWVEGNVTIELSQPKIIKQLKIVFSGQASAKSSPASSSDMIQELLFDGMMIRLVHTGDLGTEIPAGQHNYPFTFQLPPNIPSSFESAHGSVRYTLTATLSRPNKSVDRRRVKTVKVRDLIDFSTPNLSGSRSASLEWMACNLCCIYRCWVPLSATIDRGGYCPGDSLTITVNHTHRIISSISALLRQKITYNIGSRDCRTIVYVISRIGNSGFRGESMKTAIMSVPYTAIPSIDNCRILQISYELCILQSFKTPNFQKNSVCIPLVIGNTQRGYSQPILNNAVLPASNVANIPMSNNADGFLGESTTEYAIPETPPPPYSVVLADSYPHVDSS